MWSQEISREDWACLWGVQAEALTKLCGSTYIDPTTYSADLHVQSSKFTVCVQNKYCVQFCYVLDCKYGAWSFQSNIWNHISLIN